MTKGSSHSILLGRSTLEHAPSMSLTSHLTHHPLGAAVARSPHPASGGGGEGWSILLVSQSERGNGPISASIDSPHMREVQTFVAVRQAGGCVRTRPRHSGLALPAPAHSCHGSGKQLLGIREGVP
jgi:hypothetical protein